MSCSEISHAHIDLILTVIQRVSPSYIEHVGSKIGAEGMTNADTIGNMLTYANYSSYYTRYPDSERVAPRLYTFHAIPGDIPIMHALKAIDALRYQCSDWGFWQGSDARRVADQMRDIIISKLPGYDEAPTWSFMDSERNRYRLGHLNTTEVWAV